MGSTNFKAAAAHVAPVYLDPLESAEKACSVIAEAARNGASLVVFQRAFFPGFPSGRHFTHPFNRTDISNAS